MSPFTSRRVKSCGCQLEIPVKMGTFVLAQAEATFSHGARKSSGYIGLSSWVFCSSIPQVPWQLQMGGGGAMDLATDKAATGIPTDQASALSLLPCPPHTSFQKPILEHQVLCKAVLSPGGASCQSKPLRLSLGALTSPGCPERIYLATLTLSFTL